MKMQAGDHVIFSRLDRGFRLGRDLLNMHAAWHDRGVTLHFADMQLDTSTAVGKVFMTVAVAFAEWYSSALSERMKASNEWRRRVGGAMNTPRRGYKRVYVTTPERWREVPDPEKIAVMQEIARLREVEKKTWPVIMKEIETKTPYKVVSDCEQADTELLGTLLYINKSLLNRNQQNEVRELELTLGVEVVWRDLRDGRILSNRRPTRQIDPTLAPFDPNNPLPPEGPEAPFPVLVQATGRGLPEVGETSTTAIQMAIDRAAVQIVNLMEKPWHLDDCK